MIKKNCRQDINIILSKKRRY